jgi:glycerol-3-phosphate acyltransferase PlsY
MTVHREQSMKREDQQYATIRCLLLTSISTCFGHHYAHLQENNGPVTAFGVLFWFCWMWLVAVVGLCLVGCEHCEQSNRNLHSAHTLQDSAPTTATNHIQQIQNNTPNAVKGSLFS